MSFLSAGPGILCQTVRPEERVRRKENRVPLGSNLSRAAQSLLVLAAGLFQHSETRGGGVEWKVAAALSAETAGAWWERCSSERSLLTGCRLPAGPVSCLCETLASSVPWVAQKRVWNVLA